MQFSLIDRVLEVESGRRIVAEKCVSLAEEYLAEHFPDFPILPGVLMLESMVEAARWLVYEAQDFARPVVLLESVRGVTYKAFVAPGQILRVEVQCKSLSSDRSEFAGVGLCGDREAVKGRFTLSHGTVADDVGGHAGLRSADERMVRNARRRWHRIWQEASSPASHAAR